MPSAALLSLLLLLPPSAAALADGIEEKVALCSGCHGETGVPLDKSVPVIAGQTEGYLYLQLRDYKLGNRKNEIMQQVAGDLEKADMRALAAHFASQPWPNLQQPTAPTPIAAHAMVVAGSAVCTSCHLEGYVGDSAAPRVAAQGVDYLRATMRAFKAGERANNPWMAALLKTYTDEDIEALAQYLAGL